MQVRIAESSQAGEARRLAVAEAEAIGFDEERVGRAALIVTELARNLVKHTPRGGDLFVHAGASEVEVVSVDRGPGLDDVEGSLRDGFSTAGSPGTGLGAVRRLADEFDLYTTPGRGTVVLARVRDGSAPTGRVVAGGVSACHERESVCGDAFAVVERQGGTRIIVADGLGHGPGANEAAMEAVRVFGAEQGPLPEVLESIHHALRHTRGAAVSVVEIDPHGGELAFAGVGNVGGTIVAAQGARALVSHNGTAGHAVRRIQEFRYELPREALLVLHSDGLKTRWSLDDQPGLARRDPVVVAATLYRDFARGRDDATAVVARWT